MQALVNLGRVKLANELGLFVPYEIEHERRMWWLLKLFVYRNDITAAQELNAVYRTTQPASAPPKIEEAKERVPAAGTSDQEAKGRAPAAGTSDQEAQGRAPPAAGAADQDEGEPEETGDE